MRLAAPAGDPGPLVRVGAASRPVAVDTGPPAALVVVEVRLRGRRDFGLAEETWITSSGALRHAVRAHRRRREASGGERCREPAAVRPSPSSGSGWPRRRSAPPGIRPNRAGAQGTRAARAGTRRGQAASSRRPAPPRRAPRAAGEARTPARRVPLRPEEPQDGGCRLPSSWRTNARAVSSDCTCTSAGRAEHGKHSSRDVSPGR